MKRPIISHIAVLKTVIARLTYRRIAALFIISLILAQLAALSFGQYTLRGPARRTISLHEPDLTGESSLEKVLSKCRTANRFTPESLTLTQIGQLAWAGQGIIDREKGIRTVPSAGDLYPMQIYLAINDGLFLYDPVVHNLQQTLDHDIRAPLAALCQNPAVAQAPCSIIIIGSTRNLAGEYGKRAKTYMYLEAGQIAQNILLQAVSLDLGSLTVPFFDVREVTRICRLPRGTEPVYIVSVGHTPPQDETAGTPPRPKRIALIAAATNFQDEELFGVRRVFDDTGFETVIASAGVEIIRGLHGNLTKADIALNLLILDDFDALVFIGGPGATSMFNNPAALNIARSAVQKGKIVAAIGVAPAILANAGILKGVHVTSFASQRPRLLAAGAICSDAPVERDGLIITARDPLAAVPFAQEIMNALRAPASAPSPPVAK